MIHKKINLLKIMTASALGVGLSPVAPGTLAALWGVAIHVVIYTETDPSLHVSLFLGCFIIICFLNHLLTPWAQSYWQNKDPKHFVLDEIAGYLIVPILFREGKLWQIAFWGFLFFRILDIIKIPPARQIDKRGTGSWAILLDDIIAALYAVCCLYILKWLGQQIGLEHLLISNLT